MVTARLARLLRQQVGTGLSPSQQSALASIECHGPLTLGALAAIEQVAPPTVTKVVARLEEEGLVDRIVDRADRRVTRVSITSLGRDRLEHSRLRRNAWLAGRLADLGDHDVRRLADAVDVLEALTGGATPPAGGGVPAPASASDPAGEVDATDPNVVVVATPTTRARRP
jgi:DNA-binding MarR family transcriptional regulator